MKRTYTIRLLAFVLSLVMLASLAMTAVADSIVGDINGDGKVSVFDAQLLLEAQKGLRQLEGIEGISVLDVIKLILGGMPGAIDTDNDGVIEIYSASGLKQINNDLDGSYILMNDIDMAGNEWVPIAKFTGTLNGNNKTISNVNISSSVAGLYSSKATPINQGFFGDTNHEAVIKDLNLRNVTLTASEDSQYIGLMIGSNRGQITNCTVTGTIIDTRESYAQNTYIGVLAGRICSPGTGIPVGNIIGGTGLSITDDAGVTTTTDLCANVVLQIANRDQLNLNADSYHKIGIVGWANKNATVSGTWVETTNDTARLAESVQENRATVVAYMNAMGTAQWIPSEDLAYNDGDLTRKTYLAGKTYTGLPYNRNNGSLERFQSALQADGTTIPGLGDSIWSDETGFTGFTQLMGNNCSTAVSWSWMRVSPVNVTQVDSHKVPYHGGAFAKQTSMMIPTDSIRTGYGIYAVGDWTEFSMTQDGKRVDAPYDASLAAYTVADGTLNTHDVLVSNGADTMLEAYTKGRAGDAVVAYAAPWSEEVASGGHARLMAADPIVIRNADGTIDPDKSYIITTEQGASTGAYSTWRVNYSYSFRNLLDDKTDSASTGYGRTYLPITIRALHDDAPRGSYVTQYSGDDAVTAPNHGKFYSNFRFLSSTVTVKNGDTVVYEGTVFTGVGPTGNEYGGKHQTLELAEHSDAYLAAAEAAGLVDGAACTFTVSVTTSDGKVHTPIVDKVFAYSAE